MDFLFAPFGFVFMQQALIISVLTAAAAGALSCLLVLKGWSLMGDAISHGVLPGVVLAYLAGIPLALGAFAAGMFCALGTGFLSANSRLKQDTVMGVVFSGMFALGVVIYTKIATQVHLDHILFGDMLGVGWGDIIETGAISLVCLGIIVIKRLDLLVYVFDPQHARAIGLPVGLLHYGLLAMMSLIIVAALKSVGLILSISLMIAPGAIAYLMTDRFDRMMIYSVIIAVLCAFGGIVLSFYIDSAPAPTIVVVLTGLFILVLLGAPGRGLLWRRFSGA